MLLEHKKKKPGLSPNRPSNNWALGTNTELCEKGAIFLSLKIYKRVADFQSCVTYLNALFPP